MAMVKGTGRDAIAAAIVVVIMLAVAAMMPEGGAKNSSRRNDGRAGDDGVVGSEPGGGAAFRVYLDPGGSDSNDGRSPGTAVVSLSRAQSVIAAARPAADVEVRIKQGIYQSSTVNWSTYIPGRSISFMPADYEFGKNSNDFAGRPVFRGVGGLGYWFHAAPPRGGMKSDAKLRFYYLRVEGYSSGALALDGDVSRRSDGLMVPRSNGINGNTVYGMMFSKIGSKHVLGTTGYGAINLVNSRGNLIQGNLFSRIENASTQNSRSLVHGVYLAHHSKQNIVRGNRFVKVSGDPIRIRNDSNENRVFANTFKAAGISAYVSEWFTSAECASHGNEFHNNKLISGYDGKKMPPWALKSGGTADIGHLGCNNEGQERMRVWSN